VRISDRLHSDGYSARGPPVASVIHVWSHYELVREARDYGDEEKRPDNFASRDALHLASVLHGRFVWVDGEYFHEKNQLLAWLGPS